MPYKLPLFLCLNLYTITPVFFINVISIYHKNYYRTLFNIYIYHMKATIKICKVGQFTDSQKQLLKRVTNVLEEHNLSVRLQINMKKIKLLKIKTA